MIIKVHVSLRDGLLDTQGQAICDSMHRGGSDFVKDVRVSKVFKLTVDANAENIKERVDALAKDMLSNPIIETYSIEFEDK